MMAAWMEQGQHRGVGQGNLVQASNTNEKDMGRKGNQSITWLSDWSTREALSDTRETGSGGVCSGPVKCKSFTYTSGAVKNVTGYAV